MGNGGIDKCLICSGGKGMLILPEIECVLLRRYPMHFKKTQSRTKPLFNSVLHNPRNSVAPSPFPAGTITKNAFGIFLIIVWRQQKLFSSEK